VERQCSDAELECSDVEDERSNEQQGCCVLRVVAALGKSNAATLNKVAPFGRFYGNGAFHGELPERNVAAF
jgi:hypothetical protein